MNEKEFYKMDIAPAKHTGEVFTAYFISEGAHLHRLPVEEALCHEFVPGDSAELRCKIEFDDTEKTQYVTLYLTGDVLQEFIEKYGVRNVECEFTAVVELFYDVGDVYAPTEDEEYYGFLIHSLA